MRSRLQSSISLVWNMTNRHAAGNKLQQKKLLRVTFSKYANRWGVMQRGGRFLRMPSDVFDRCIIHHMLEHVPQPQRPSAGQTIINSRWISRRASPAITRLSVFSGAPQRQQCGTVLQRHSQSRLFHYVPSKTRWFYVGVSKTDCLSFIAMKWNCAVVAGVVLQGRLHITLFTIALGMIA